MTVPAMPNDSPVVDVINQGGSPVWRVTDGTVTIIHPCGHIAQRLYKRARYLQWMERSAISAH